MWYHVFHYHVISQKFGLLFGQCSSQLNFAYAVPTVPPSPLNYLHAVPTSFLAHLDAVSIYLLYFLSFCMHYAVSTPTGYKSILFRGILLLTLIDYYVLRAIRKRPKSKNCLQKIAKNDNNFELLKEYSINVCSFVRYSITPFTPTPLLREVP